MGENINTKRCKFVTFCLTNEISPGGRNSVKEEAKHPLPDDMSAKKNQNESPESSPKNYTLSKSHHAEHQSKDEELSSGGTMSRPPMASKNADMTSLNVDPVNEASSPLVSPGAFVQIINNNNLANFDPHKDGASDFLSADIKSEHSTLSSEVLRSYPQNILDEPAENSPDDDDFCIRIIPPPIDGSAEHVEAHVEYDEPNVSENGSLKFPSQTPGTISVPFKPRNPTNGNSFNLLSLVTSVSQGQTSQIGQSTSSQHEILHRQTSWNDRSFHIKTPPFPTILEDAEQTSSFTKVSENKLNNSNNSSMLPWKFWKTPPNLDHISLKKEKLPQKPASSRKKGVKHQRWQYGLFQCHKNWKTTFYSCFFPCFVERQLSSVTNNPELSQVLTLLTVVCFVIPLLVILSFFARQTVLMWVCIVLFCAQMLQKLGFLVKLRINVRLMRNIDGACCQDCCSVFLCCPCALCQMKQELDFWPDLHQSRV